MVQGESGQRYLLQSLDELAPLIKTYPTLGQSQGVWRIGRAEMSFRRRGIISINGMGPHQDVLVEISNLAF